MCSIKLAIIGILALAGYASAAAKPLSFEDVGRKLHEFGQKAIPAFQKVCTFVNAYYPGYQQGYPQGYPEGYNQGYPQGYNGYPQSNYPQISRNVPSYPSSYEPSPKIHFPQSKSEQDDLVGTVSRDMGYLPPPPEIQDVLKNFDKLPKVDFKNSENNVLKRNSGFKIE